MKRIFTITVIIAMVLELCACGQKAPAWQEQYDLGVRYLVEGNYQEAILAFTAAIEIDPKRAPAYVGRGDAYMKSGETEDNLAAAKADYEKAIELDEANVNAYLGLADVYIRQGDTEAARTILEQGLAATEDAKLQDRLNELEQQEGRPKEASKTVTAIGYVINNLDEYLEQYDFYIDKYPRHQYGAQGQELSGIWITPCGIRFVTIVNAQFNSNVIMLQEAEANNLWELFGEETSLYFVDTDGTSGSMIGRRMELTGYFLPREEPGEVTGPEDYEAEGEGYYIYHPNGDYYFHIESYTLLD